MADLPVTLMAWAVHFMPLHFVTASLTIHLVHLAMHTAPLAGNIILLSAAIACLAFDITALDGKLLHLSGKMAHLTVMIDDVRGNTSPLAAHFFDLSEPMEQRGSAPALCAITFAPVPPTMARRDRRAWREAGVPSGGSHSSALPPIGNYFPKFR
jgi:hypothetical protein